VYESPHELQKGVNREMVPVVRWYISGVRAAESGRGSPPWFRKLFTNIPHIGRDLLPSSEYQTFFI